MCGICGIINAQEQASVSSKEVSGMMQELLHRGPDEAGEFIHKNVALAIRRLKIIDLETGSQPIHNEDGSIWVVCNGEIYNFLELRADLEKKGHKFYTHSDTEVIIHLYEESNRGFIKDLNGMFAFALWDRNKEQLILGRDRMGQKPLYYYYKNGQLIFASEIKALLKCPQISRQIDFSSLNEYLTFEYIPSPKSIFKEIRKLPASHMIVFDKGELSLERYWSLKFLERHNIDEIQAQEQLFSLLNDSVKRHLICDVPLGVFLSGGIDSSAIAAIASRLAGDKLKTFSVCFEDRSFDESRYASLMAEYIGSEHYQMRFNAKDCLELLPGIYRIIDEPFADASILPTYLLSKFTRNYVTMALGGDAGDELFAGYPTHLAHRFGERVYLKIPAFIRNYILKPVVKHLPVSYDNFSFDFKAKKFISGIEFPPEIRHQIWMGAFSPSQKNDLFLSSIRDSLVDPEGVGPLYYNLEEFNNGRISSGVHERSLFLDMRLYLQDDILTKVDRASMANSLEVRTPYLDNPLFDFVNGLDFRLKLKNGRSKYIFKKMLLSKKLVPEIIVNRPKKGFGIPVSKWIREDLKDLILDYLSPDNLKKGGIFNHKYVEKILSEHFSLRNDNRKLIWALFMFESWKKHI